MPKFKEYNSSAFIRAGGAVSWEEREAQPSDFTDQVYAKEYAEDKELFDLNYPNWQPYADYFRMRRPVYTISGRQVCATNSFKASQMDDFTAADSVSVKNFKIPGGFQGGSIPSGKWLNDGMSWTDRGDTTTEVVANYRQYGEWTKIQVKDGTPPSPAGSS